MKFEYLQRVVVDADIEIDNIGDCVLEATNDLGEQFYLIIRTILGWTEILEYGPCLPDFELLSASYNIKYSRIEFNMAKIERIIDKFLNDAKRVITQARLTTLEDIRDCLVNPIDKLMEDSNE